MVKFRNYRMEVGDQSLLVFTSADVFTVAVTQSQSFLKGLVNIRRGIKLLDILSEAKKEMALVSKEMASIKAKKEKAKEEIGLVNKGATKVKANLSEQELEKEPEQELFIEIEDEMWEMLVSAMDEVQWAGNILSFEEFWDSFFKEMDDFEKAATMAAQPTSSTNKKKFKSV